MAVFYQYLFLFFAGAFAGWIIELFFRRFVSAKKWINPGFLSGPYLPLYGTGTVVLFAVCSMSATVWAKILLIAVLMTLTEYLTGLFFLKVMEVRLWDYSSRKFNVQGLICPLFSLIWAILGIGFLFLIFPLLENSLQWFSDTDAPAFVLGVLSGVFIIDVWQSFRISLKIRKIAKDVHAVVKYEQFKLHIRLEAIKKNFKTSFLFPFKSDKPLSQKVSDFLSANKEKDKKPKMHEIYNDLIKNLFVNNEAKDEQQEDKHDSN